MTLHDLYDLLGNGCINLVQRVDNEGDCTIYTGSIADFPYRLMHDYGYCDVLAVELDEIYLPVNVTCAHSFRVVISRDEKEDY